MPVVIKTPDSPRDRGARLEVEPRWGAKRQGRHLVHQRPRTEVKTNFSSSLSRENHAKTAGSSG